VSETDRQVDPAALHAVATAIGLDVPADQLPALAAAVERILADAARLRRHALGQTPPAAAFRPDRG
jgi:hypothetical protein